MTEQIKPASRMQKFRQENPRIDYYPTKEAAAAIERLRQGNQGESTRLLVDMLVCAGIKTLVPKRRAKVSG